MSGPDKITRKAFLFGEGAMQLPSLASGEKDSDKADTAAAAGFGFGYDGPWVDALASIRKGSNETIEASEDSAGNIVKPTQANIGNSIFSPQISDMNFDLKLSVYPFLLSDEGPGSLPLKAWLGFQGYASAGGYMWEYPSSDQLSTESIEAQPFSFGAGVGVHWIGNTDSNDLTLKAQLGYAARVIGGDAGNKVEVRRQLLGTSTRYFHGPELTLGATLGGLTFGLGLTLLFPAKQDNDYVGDDYNDSKVDGLTGLRFTPVITAIAPLTLKEWEQGAPKE